MGSGEQGNRDAGVHEGTESKAAVLCDSWRQHAARRSPELAYRLVRLLPLSDQ